MYDECGSNSFRIAVRVDSTIFLSLILSTYRLEMAVSAFDNLRCCIEDMPCAKRIVVNMQKMRRAESFFMIQCQFFYFANRIALIGRFFWKRTAKIHFFVVSVCAVYI